MADLATAMASRQTAVGGNTLDNETRAWNRYSEYCRSIGLGDNLFLEDMSKTHRIEIIGGFAVAVRQGQFSRPRDAPLAESTVSDTLNHVAAVFRENGHDDPKRDAERNVARLLRRQLRSYKKDDPKEGQQKALPVCVLRLILSSKSTELCQAMGELAGAAHFWAMRSCEYAKVPKQSRAKADKATMHQKYCLHKRWRIHRPQVSCPSSSRLCFGHFRTTEIRQKGRYRHSVADFGRASVPRKNLGIVNKKNQFLQGLLD